jgi:hypothetical protein
VRDVRSSARPVAPMTANRAETVQLATAWGPVCPQVVSGFPPRTGSPSTARALTGSFASRGDRAGSRSRVSLDFLSRRQGSRQIQSWRYSACVRNFRGQKTIWSSQRAAPTCGIGRTPMHKVGRPIFLDPNFPVPGRACEGQRETTKTQPHTTIQHPDPHLVMRIVAAEGGLSVT